jgi:hypothetical protein
MRIDENRAFDMRDCPGCGTEVAENHNRCPICGYELPHPGPARRWVWPITATLVLLALLAWLL